MLYGWKLSYYTAKVRSYLIYKQIPYFEKDVNMFDLNYTIKKKTGAKVMPVVVTEKNEWLQDSRDIINKLETKYPFPSVIPSSPVLRFASGLLEAWADEFWIPHAMFARWHHAENREFFKKEAGDSLFPMMPRFVKDRGAAVVMKVLQSYLPGVGIRPSQHQILTDWMNSTLGQLDVHFASNLYLLGSTPSIADFALFGPLGPHLGRDPWPRQHLIAPHPHLVRWLDRMTSLGFEEVLRRNSESAAAITSTSTTTSTSAVVESTAVTTPPSLDPVFRIVFSEFLPMVIAINDKVAPLSLSCTLVAGRRIARNLGDITFPMHGQPFTRGAIPFTLWRMQDLLDDYQRMSEAERREVAVWLQSFGVEAEALLQLKIPRLERSAISVRFCPASASTTTSPSH